MNIPLKSKVTVQQPESPAPVVLTSKDMFALLDEEKRKLQDPLYLGGGDNPLYGPRVNHNEYIRETGNLPHRDYYKFLLVSEAYRLKYDERKRRIISK